MLVTCDPSQVCQRAMLFRECVVVRASHRNPEVIFDCREGQCTHCAWVEPHSEDRSRKCPCRDQCLSILNWGQIAKSPTDAASRVDHQNPEASPQSKSLPPRPPAGPQRFQDRSTQRHCTQVDPTPRRGDLVRSTIGHTCIPILKPLQVRASGPASSWKAALLFPRSLGPSVPASLTPAP